MALQDVSNHLGVSWDTIKEIHSSYLKHHYSPPSLDGVENIGIDEFAVRKGHVYKTIVVDLDSGRIIYVDDGKGSEALNKFWWKVKRKNIKIKVMKRNAYGFRDVKYFTLRLYTLHDCRITRKVG
mgnify:CR=1 FL=1